MTVESKTDGGRLTRLEGDCFGYLTGCAALEDRSREMVLYFYKDVNFSEFTGWCAAL